jgi:hypothetical protein
MKLYRVEVMKVLYVLAESEHEADLDAQQYANDADAEDVFVSEAKSLDEVDPQWRDALPYGTNDDVTIEKWFERPEEPQPFVDPPEQMRFEFGT